MDFMMQWIVNRTSRWKAYVERAVGESASPLKSISIRREVEDSKIVLTVGVRIVSGDAFAVFLMPMRISQFEQE